MTPSLPYFMMQFPSRAKDATVQGECTVVVGQSWLGPGTTFAEAKAAITDSHRGSRWVVWNFDMPGISQWVISSLGAFSATLALALLLYGVKVLILGGQITYWEEWNQVRLDPQGFSPAPGDQSLPSIRQYWSLSAGELFDSHLALALSPLSPALALPPR